MQQSHSNVTMHKDGHSASLTYVAAMLMLASLGVFFHEAGLDVITTVFFRCLFAALALGLYCWQRGMLVRRNLAGKGLALAGFGGVLMVLNWVLFFQAISYIGISLATIVFHVQPFLVLLMATVFLHEKISLQQLAWVGLGFAGLLLACGLQTASQDRGAHYFTGLLCTLGAALAYAGVTLTTRAMQKRQSVPAMPPHLIALVHCLVGVVLLGGFIHMPASGVSQAQWAWLAGMGLLPTALAYVLIYAALPRMQTSAIAVLTFIYPAAAVGVDYLVYGQHVNLMQMAGLLLIVLASLGINLNWRWRWRMLVRS